MTGLVSVVVCTRNRARSLARCLDAIERAAGERAIEIVVVDNGSADETGEMLATRAARDPRLRSVREERLGVAVARNRGWREARGDVVLWADDDTEPRGGWVDALLEALAGPEVMVAGGPIRPRYEVPAPSWLSAHHVLALACLDYGAERREITEFPYLFTANLAVRRRDLETLGGFDERLGRRGTALLSGEDTDFCERARAAGGRLLYEPRAAVDHWIGGERLTREYFRRRDFGTGRTRARQAAGGRLLAAAGKLAKLPIHSLLWMIARVVGDDAAAAESTRSMMATLGFASEVLRPAKRAGHS